MAIENHEQVTIYSNSGNIQAVYKTGSYKGLDLKIESVMHTDGSKGVIRQVINPSGSTLPFLKLDITRTKTFHKILVDIVKTRELVDIKTSSGIAIKARLEEVPEFSFPSGDMSVTFLTEIDNTTI